MIFTLILLPLVSLFLVGLILFYFPPKKINNWYGYRTGQSIESQKKWDIAQKYAAKKIIEASTILGSIELVVFYFYNDLLMPIIVIINSIAILLYVFQSTENRLSNLK